MGQRRLAGAVGDAQRRGAQARDRGDVDDGAAAGLAPSAARRAGVARNGPVRLTAITRCHSSSVVSSSGLNTAVPALLTSASSRPKRAVSASKACAERPGIGDVAGQRQRRARARPMSAMTALLQVRGVDVEQRDLPALLQEELCGGEPDAAGGAGDEGSSGDRGMGSGPAACTCGPLPGALCTSLQAPREAPENPGRSLDKAPRPAVWPAHSTENSVPNARVITRDNGHGETHEHHRTARQRADRQAQRRREIPHFQPGDTVQVNVKVKEGERSRVQAYEGVCIARNGGGLNESLHRPQDFLWRGRRARLPAVFAEHRSASRSSARARCVAPSCITCAIVAASRPASPSASRPVRPRATRPPPRSKSAASTRRFETRSFGAAFLFGASCVKRAVILAQRSEAPDPS